MSSPLLIMYVVKLLPYSQVSYFVDICSVFLDPVLRSHTPHLCNFLWLPFTAQIWCTCMSPIKATCLVYLSPVSPGSLLLAATCLTAFSCYFMHCVWPYFFAFFSFFYFGKMRNPVKWWEKSQLIWCSDIFGYVDVEPCNTNTSSGETGPSSPAELRLAFMPT